MLKQFRKDDILYIAYPLLPVSDESCGGAEQILWSLEQEMSARGRATSVAACESSRVRGELLATGVAPNQDDTFEQRNEQHARKVLELCGKNKFSVVHDHSGSFWRHAADLDIPVLATLHLPRALYGEHMFRALPHNVYFNCVSESQLQEFRDLPRMLGVVRNGIPVDRFPFARKKDEYLLWLGRICEEKAPHLAIEAAKRAGLKLIIAGQVYPFSYHKDYFDREVAPKLEAGRVEFVELPTFKQKLELLRCAKALLVTSTVPETCSLVALEAQACGTPVVSFRTGALPEAVSHGHTGYTVKSVADMAAAVHDVEHIWPEECRHHVEQNFSSRAMADGYEHLYDIVIRESEDAMQMAA